MENILTELWPYLLLFYLIDGIRSLNMCEIGLSSCTGMRKRFRLTAPGSFFLSILPGGFLLRADQTPILSTDTALYLPKDKKLSLTTITPVDFAKIFYKDRQMPSADGKDILLNDKKYLTLVSDIKTAFWTKQISTLFESTQHWEITQEFYRQRMDLKKAEADWNRNENLLLSISWLCRILFILLFILLPLYLYTNILNAPILTPLLLLILTNFIAIIGTVGYALHQIYEQSIGKITTELLLMLLSPLSVPQALMHISANLLHQYDWLVAVALLGSEADFYRHVRQRLHYINKMKEHMDDPSWIDFWLQDQALVSALVEQSGSSLEVIYMHPLRQDNTSASYCPVCHSEYLSGYDTCHDCQARLQPFAL